MFLTAFLQRQSGAEPLRRGRADERLRQPRQAPRQGQKRVDGEALPLRATPKQRAKQLEGGAGHASYEKKRKTSLKEVTYETIEKKR